MSVFHNDDLRESMNFLSIKKDDFSKSTVKQKKEIANALEIVLKAFVKLDTDYEKLESSHKDLEKKHKQWVKDVEQRFELK